MKPAVLLHICCAPCSIVPIERLRTDYEVIGFFYNPNIYPQKEYRLRAIECKKYCTEEGIVIVEGSYNSKDWYNLIKDREGDPEGGKRCEICFRMRLEETAKTAGSLKMNYFTTTLSISPHKNYDLIRTIGSEMAAENGVSFIKEDFKKKNGYRRSCELSKQKNMYRQNYCGCEFSIRNS